MRKLIAAILFTLVCVLPASAQVTMGDQIITIGGGYSYGTLKNFDDQTVDGGMLGITLDQVGNSKPISFAVSFGYSRVDMVEDTGQVIRRSVVTWPLGAGARAWLGQSKVQGYAGALIAVYFSSMTVTNESIGESYTAFATSGWGMQIPLGVVLNLSPKVFINAGYTLNWLWSNDALANDMMHSFVAGLGFKLNG